MSEDRIRTRIENEMFARMEKKYSEEEQANYLMSLLMDNYPLLSAVTIALDPEGEEPSIFAHRGLSGNYIKQMYTMKSLPVITAARKDPVIVGEKDERAKDPTFRLEHAYKSLYAVPCRLQEETWGIFVADSDDPGLFTSETLESFFAYSRLATFFLALRSLRGRISRVPDVDSVTGLYTFKYFHEVLHRELTRGEIRPPGEPSVPEGPEPPRDERGVRARGGGRRPRRGGEADQGDSPGGGLRRPIRRNVPHRAFPDGEDGSGERREADHRLDERLPGREGGHPHHGGDRRDAVPEGRRHGAGADPVHRSDGPRVDAKRRKRNDHLQGLGSGGRRAIFLDNAKLHGGK